MAIGEDQDLSLGPKTNWTMFSVSIAVWSIIWVQSFWSIANQWRRIKASSDF